MRAVRLEMAGAEPGAPLQGRQLDLVTDLVDMHAPDPLLANLDRHGATVVCYNGARCIYVRAWAGSYVRLSVSSALRQSSSDDSRIPRVVNLPQLAPRYTETAEETAAWDAACLMAAMAVGV